MAGNSTKGKNRHKLVGEDVLLMGIVNVTPDSFSDGGEHNSAEAAFTHALSLASEGADILDIGGESTRPGAAPVTVDEELERVIPVIEQLKNFKDTQTSEQLPAVKISIDTRKALVMREAIKAGADIINDVTALQYDEDSLRVAADSRCPVILMHGKGNPKTMQNNPTYNDVVAEVHDYLVERIAVCESAGIARSKLVIDPGIGFGKTLEHNLSLLANLEKFNDLGVPLLLGASRKRFIGSLCGETDAAKRAPGSIAAALHAVSQGAKILRVHDIKKTRQALKVWQAIEASKD